jgi:2-dehydropantoate 2-reductase
LNTLIIGAGAIGCLVGGKLAASGQPVTLVGRPHFAEIVSTQGIILVDANGSHPVRNVQAAGSLAEAFRRSPDEYDIAILTVKSYDTEMALEELRMAAKVVNASLPVVLSLQNGVGNEEAIAAVVGKERVIAGTITTPVQVVSPGVIQLEKPKHFIGISPWDTQISPKLMVAVQQVLQTAGINVQTYPQASGMKWTKLLMNMVGNATSAILAEPPQQVFADPALVDLEIDAWREALAVMQRAGIAPVNLGKYPFRWLAPLIRRLPKPLLRPALRSQAGGARGDKLPSLHLDLNAGKAQSEVAWLNGAVTQRGKLLGVPTPVNTHLTETLLSLVQHTDERAEWRHNHRRLVEASQ